MAAVDLSTFIRTLRVWSGIILFFYAFTHLLNHSVNILSIQAADFVNENYFDLIWKNVVGSVLLYGSLVIHILLGFYAVGTRKSFKMTGKEWIQIIFPILALLVLLQHIGAIAVATKIFDVDINYTLLLSLMISEPTEVAAGTFLFSLMTIFIWVHGAIGINTLLRYNMKSYGKYKSYFYLVFYGVPILGVFGFWAALKEQSFIAYAKTIQGDENFIFSIIMESVPQEAFPTLMAIEPLVMNNYPIIVLGLMVIAIANVVRARFFGRIKIHYSNNKIVSVPKGTSVLEASRLAGIPHQSVCGGKARCTTCRIHVISHEGDLPVPTALEANAIERAGLESDVRLACQLKPMKDLTIIPLVNPENSLEGATNRRALSGREQETVVLFIDLRDFTKLSEKKLPYDVVYILNKYYSVCGKIIEEEGGRLDKFIGDGIMAIFDSSPDASENCRNAVKSSVQISRDMKSLNDEMKIDFSEEIRFGMGIHSGDAIVGLMGYGKTFTETVVGDNVNVASRLEELTKTYKAELVLSKYVAEKANLNLKDFKGDTVKIRGRKEDLDILSVTDASSVSI